MSVQDCPITTFACIEDEYEELATAVEHMAEVLESFLEVAPTTTLSEIREVLISFREAAARRVL